MRFIWLLLIRNQSNLRNDTLISLSPRIVQTQKSPALRGFQDFLGSLRIVSWWRRRELNPRPLALGNWLYMLSFRLLI